MTVYVLLKQPCNKSDNPLNDNSLKCKLQVIGSLGTLKTPDWSMVV